jgi:hypothetical protein
VTAFSLLNSVLSFVILSPRKKIQVCDIDHLFQMHVKST